MSKPSTKPFVGLVAIAHGTPVDVQTAAELAPLIGKDRDWIVDHAGVATRHVCRRYDDPATLVSSIAKPLIKEFGSPDLLINASAMPRQLLPDGSVFVARELGLSGLPTFSVNATCLSFLLAMNHARVLILDGQYDQVMIVCCEFPSMSRNLSQPESAALFGDAAAVAIMARGQGWPFASFKMATFPAAAEYAQVRGGGVLRMPDDDNTTPDDHVFDMRGETLLRFTLPRLKRFLRNFLLENDLAMEDIDLVVPHQASRSGMQVLQKLGFDESRTVNILADYGNCVAASIPMALSIARQENRIKHGDTVLLIGTAAGMSIGAGLLRC